MAKNNKTLKRNLMTAIGIGVLGAATLFVVSTAIQITGYAPVAIFSTFYTLGCLEFVMAVGLKNNIKTVLGLRFVNKFEKQNSKSKDLYDELSLKKQAIKDKLSFLNQEMTESDKKQLVDELVLLEGDYNDALNSFDSLSENEKKKFEKYSRYAGVFNPINFDPLKFVIFEKEFNENVVEPVKTKNKQKSNAKLVENALNGNVKTPKPETVSQNVLSKNASGAISSAINENIFVKVEDKDM